MTKLEQVIYGLDCCSWGIKCSFCPYKDEPECKTVLMCDAIALLKKQNEDITPIESTAKQKEFANKLNIAVSDFWCGECHFNLIGHPKFCPNCGKKVKWDG